MLKNKLLIILMVSACVGTFFLYNNRPFSTRLAAYVTDLSARTPAQVRNIQRAERILSGFILKSGEEFSLNAQAGPYTLKRGYQPERSFRGEGTEISPGGGVCQLASTLYNAARLADLEVLERIPHSQEVESVPRGMDATVAYGVADLKLRNPHPFPVKIVSKIHQDQLKIEIWGEIL